MQGCHRHASQTRRYALDRSRLQCHHRSPLLKTQWSFSRLLGAPIRTQRRLIHHFLGVHPALSHQGHEVSQRFLASGVFLSGPLCPWWLRDFANCTTTMDRYNNLELPSMNLDDTIVAIATPPGRGGIGVVRLAGPQARAIVAPMLQLKRPLEPGRAV